MKNMKKTIFAIIILLTLLMTACSTKYICYNGIETKNKKDCPAYPTITLTELKANRVSENWARAYTTNPELSYTLVTSYPTKGDWYSDILFTERETGQVNQITIKIDGRTSSVTCYEGCEHLNITTNQTQNVTIQP